MSKEGLLTLEQKIRKFSMNKLYTITDDI